ncbi:NAD(P)/FAD-dependent oxidoreductase [Kribbella sp. NPDC050124]|uniref:NAD(P)/FAD-dependent oxidoreductase n=1 Tax=Kribbella sp. NPDC050124 TaxID=3364114 RepID=UPI0037A56E7E
MATELSPEVVVVGGGPAGLTAAAQLARTGTDVLVVEREREAGGIPRHSDHTGYGIRDLRRVLRGPDYAHFLSDAARAAGVTIMTDSMVTGWEGETAVQVTSPRGLIRLEAPAIVLATGARERPRPARRIPGDRPRGVYTTGQLQNLVHLHHQPVGKRAVVVGSELVSWSSVLTLKHADCRTVLMTSAYPQTEVYLAFSVPGRMMYGVKVAHSTRVVRVIGRGQVEAVEVENTVTADRTTVECDTVVFTADWIPDNELARAAGLTMDPGSLAPVVDRTLRTSRPGVFAAGNLVHPVDTADVAALDGLHVADQVRKWLDTRSSAGASVPLVAGPPFRWVAPGLLRADDPAPPRDRLLLWPEELIRLPTVTVEQAGQVLVRKRVPWPAAPGRIFRLPAGMLDRVDLAGGPVRISAR